MKGSRGPRHERFHHPNEEESSPHPYYSFAFVAGKESKGVQKWKK